jgi:hypothetical protein
MLLLRPGKLYEKIKPAVVKYIREIRKMPSTSKIKQIIEQAIGELKRICETNPKLIWEESDVLCILYRLLSDKLRGKGLHIHTGRSIEGYKKGTGRCDLVIEAIPKAQLNGLVKLPNVYGAIELKIMGDMQQIDEKEKGNTLKMDYKNLKALPSTFPKYVILVFDCWSRPKKYDCRSWGKMVRTKADNLKIKSIPKRNLFVEIIHQKDRCDG